MLYLCLVLYFNFLTLAFVFVCVFSDVHIFCYLIVQVHTISHLNREMLEPVLLKAAVLMCRETNCDEVRVVSDLCQVSHLWWIVLHSCHRQKRAQFQHLLDSEFLSRLWFNQRGLFLTFRDATHL